MTEIVNTHQSEAWNGYEGTHWADNHDRYDALNGAYNPHLLAAVGAGDRVLDLGCGNGQVTRLAARRGAHATGVDLSAPMLARARSCAQAEGVDNVTFEQGDVQVHPFAADSYDVVLSRFGVMFYADPVAAFANVRRALRPGGRLAFLCIRGLGDLGPVLRAIGGPSPVGPDGSGPLSLSDPDVVRRTLTDAGFTDIGVAAVDEPQWWGADVADATAFLLAWGPVRHALGEDTSHVRDAVAAALAPHAGPEGVRLLGNAWLVTAS
ncbi:class I SAM-dependent methyltransferase [Saccharothrix violaceirubra]|uniref:SAM-dependent methyltransferase n=1 Tax=Saccharothrix violaceirubra TaxID=413306 RepID=A0A7W7T326_9PSEU|nr:class I SAM-dependent methyltransferase [Saccharothrix violaceirubra]MBB4965669.1 SAM-dependent methyltransferase [Saccharothrix violaceirubra]